MGNINLIKFSFFVWLRFQLVTLGLGAFLCLISFNIGAFVTLGYVELINAAFSAVGCTTYGFLVYALVKSNEIEFQSQLKPIFYHAGWLNVVLLFALYMVIGFFTSEIDKGIFVVMGLAFAVILVGQIAIYWTISKLELNDFDSEKLENLLNEFGTEVKEEY